jgi:hypothetical protein
MILFITTAVKTSNPTKQVIDVLKLVWQPVIEEGRIL